MHEYQKAIEKELERLQELIQDEDTTLAQLNAYNDMIEAIRNIGNEIVWISTRP